MPKRLRTLNQNVLREEAFRECKAHQVSFFPVIIRTIKNLLRNT